MTHSEIYKPEHRAAWEVWFDHLMDSGCDEGNGRVRLWSKVTQEVRDVIREHERFMYPGTWWHRYQSVPSAGFQRLTHYRRQAHIIGAGLEGIYQLGPLKKRNRL